MTNARREIHRKQRVIEYVEWIIRRDRLSGLQAAWPQQTPEPRRAARRTHAPLREAGSRPPRAGGREIPDACAEERCGVASTRPSMMPREFAH